MGYEFVDEDEKTICFGSYCDCGYGAQPGRKNGYEFVDEDEKTICFGGKMGTVPKLRS